MRPTDTSNKKSILFVDDEVKVLNGVKRILAPMRNEWEMVFLSDSEIACEQIKDREFNIVVTDMQMPRLDGAELLKEIAINSPSTVRMVLSGHSAENTTLSAIRDSHQYISKPCRKDELMSRLSLTIQSSHLLNDQKLKQIISRITVLPSTHKARQFLMQELNKNNPCIHQVADTIRSDIAMSLKILQIVNSGYYGNHGDITDIRYAVTLLGIEALSNMALHSNIFQHVPEPIASEFLLKILDRAPNSADSVVKRMCKSSLTANEIEVAYVTGLFAELGRMILVFCCPEDYQTIKEKVLKDKISLEAAEKEIFGVDQRSITSYILALWGLPRQLVKIMAQDEQLKSINQKYYE